MNRNDSEIFDLEPHAVVRHVAAAPARHDSFSGGRGRWLGARGARGACALAATAGCGLMLWFGSGWLAAPLDGSSIRVLPLQRMAAPARPGLSSEALDSATADTPVSKRTERAERLKARKEAARAKHEAARERQASAAQARREAAEAKHAEYAAAMQARREAAEEKKAAAKAKHAEAHEKYVAAMQARREAAEEQKEAAKSKHAEAHEKYVAAMQARREAAEEKKEAAKAKHEEAHAKYVAAMQARRDAAEARREAARHPHETDSSERDSALDSNAVGSSSGNVAISGSGAGGTLRINSLPWAQVFVDGRMVGTTPQRGLSVTPGEHVVRLFNPTFDMSKTFHVRIAKGQQVTRGELLEE